MPPRLARIAMAIVGSLLLACRQSKPPAGPPVPTPSEEIVVYAAPSRELDVWVESAGGSYSCNEKVTADHPCTLHNVPPGPATVHVGSGDDFSKTLFVGYDGRANVTVDVRSHLYKWVGVGAFVGGVLFFLAGAFTLSDGHSEDKSKGDAYVGIGGLLVAGGCVALGYEMFAPVGSMRVERAGQPPIESRSTLRFAGAALSPASTGAGAIGGATFTF